MWTDMLINILLNMKNKFIVFIVFVWWHHVGNNVVKLCS